MCSGNKQSAQKIKWLIDKLVVILASTLFIIPRGTSIQKTYYTNDIDSRSNWVGNNIVRKCKWPTARWLELIIWREK